MKVAIIGAGLSGLVCAFELKRYGVVPVIFEKRNKVGDSLDTPGAVLRMFNPYSGDPLKFLKRECRIDVSGFSRIREVKMHSPGKSIRVKANHGYLIKRGTGPDSLETRLAEKVNLPIVFDTLVDCNMVNDIKKDFNYIVVANGNASISEGLGLFNITMQVWARAAVAVGEFSTDFVEVWLNTRYSKNCYCYLMPVSNKEARIVMLVNNISQSELNYYWDEFFRIERIPYKITEIRDYEYKQGIVKTPRHENLLFTGNACGLVDNFLGLGMMNAVKSGLAAAECILKNIDYTKRLKPLIKNVTLLEEFRKAMNNAENRDYDRLLSFISLPGVRSIIYRNPLIHIRQFYPAVKLFRFLRE